MSKRRPRVLIVASHPIQYYAPLYRRYAADPRIDLYVAYCSLQGAHSGLDADFGVNVAWDVPLLDGYTWTEVPNRSPRPRLDAFFGCANPGLWSMISTGRYDVVVCHGYSLASYWIAGAAAVYAGTRIALVLDTQTLGGVAPKQWKIAAKRLLLPRFYRQMDGLLSTSSRGVNFLRDLGAPPDRVHLIPNVVDNASFAKGAEASDTPALRARLNIPPEVPVALFSGKLVPWKRPSDAVRTVATQSSLHLIVAGDGVEREGLEQLARELRVDTRVHFLGFVNQRSLPAVYAASDFLVLPSSFEPFGLVVNEAFACGKPAIVSDACGAVGDLVVDGVTGLVVPVDDLAALSQACARVVDNPALRDRLGAAARERVGRWGLRQNAEAFVRACTEICADERRPLIRRG